MSLISLHWAVIMGRVSTEPEKKCLFAQLDKTYNQSEQRSHQRGQLINTIFTESCRKDGKNIFSIDKCLDRVSLFLFQNECAVDVFSHISINTYLSSPAAAMFVENEFNPSDVVDYVTVDH